MSMIMILDSVSEEAAVEHSEPSIPCNALGGWGAGMLSDEFDDDDNSLSLEKAWHGLHFLLTGDAWTGSGYRAFLLCGGTEQGEDWGYGPSRLFNPGEVREINETLQPISSDELWSHFDADQMADADIYGAGWDDELETDLREEYLEYFEQLKEFVSNTAGEGNSLRITIN